MRQAGSLGVRQHRLLRELIVRTQDTLLGPYLTPQTFELAKADAGKFTSSQREYDDGPRFLEHFDGELGPSRLAGKNVLDLGCGYGGRTVFYGELGPTSVTGIEIAERVIERCRGFAAARHVNNVEFLVAFAEDMPFADGSFDQIVCYDVLEHVQDPVLAFREIRRVLRPGGEAWLVFPTYLGARASHLDYLTQIPALHRIFDPEVIIEVVNELLSADRDTLGVTDQPRPFVGPLGRRALPHVNGMTRREAIALIERTGLEIRRAGATPFITKAAPAPLNRLAPLLDAYTRRTWPPDLLVGGLRFHLVAP